MNWTPDDRAALGLFILTIAFVLIRHTDRDRFRAMADSFRAAWSDTIGAWCARRRLRKRVWIERGPSEACRRDLNCGSWT